MAFKEQLKHFLNNLCGNKGHSFAAEIYQYYQPQWQNKHVFTRGDKKVFLNEGYNIDFLSYVELLYSSVESPQELIYKFVKTTGEEALVGFFGSFDHFFECSIFANWYFVKPVQKTITVYEKDHDE